MQHSAIMIHDFNFLSSPEYLLFSFEARVDASDDKLTKWRCKVGKSRNKALIATNDENTHLMSKTFFTFINTRDKSFAIRSIFALILGRQTINFIYALNQGP